MDYKITLEEIVNEQAFESTIERKSVDDANSICMRLIVEALPKGYNNTPNVPTPHQLTFTLYQDCPGVISSLREYVYRYVNCDAYDGECLALWCNETVFCWHKCVSSWEKNYWMWCDDYEFYYYNCQKYAQECTDINLLQSRTSMFCHIHDQAWSR